MILPGSKVRDTVTGFSGIATSRTQYLFGCVHVGIEKQGLDKDGLPQKTQFFDEQRIEIIEERPPKVSADSSATSGGPVPGSDRE